MAHPLAGSPAPAELLVNIPRLITDYFTTVPDPDAPGQRVTFGTNGHRGRSADGSFNEAHIVAICAALVEERARAGIDGPLFLGIDTHALSEPALVTAVEVLAAAGVTVILQADRGYTPTPVISHAILVHNRGRSAGLADGVVVTPSHNPPDYGGFKYNATHGGPADPGTTERIQARANDLLNTWRRVPRLPFAAALATDHVITRDLVRPFVDDLGSVVDMERIASSGVRLGVDPLGGAGVGYWSPIRERWGIDIEVINSQVDPTFRFMHVDKDGQIRMDCSSPWAMVGLVEHKDRFDLCFGNDPDTDRHGIVTPTEGLMNPNHFLAVCIDYLFRHRSGWSAGLQVGKTLVSSAMIDRVSAAMGRRLCEVPVGFKWFVDGLCDGTLGFGGEESAGASFLRRDGTVWTTDKDGLIMDLLAAEILAVTGRDPSQLYAGLTEQHGSPVYRRVDAPVSIAGKAALKGLTPESVTADTLAGEPIQHVLVRAPGNDAPIGGVKVVTDDGWFAARPSGTEPIYKIYAESFRGSSHLDAILAEAQELVDSALP